MKCFFYTLVVAFAAIGCSKVHPSTDPDVRQIAVRSSIEGVSSKGLVASDSALAGIVFVRIDSVKSGLTEVGFSATASITAGRDSAGALTFNPTQQYDQDNKHSYFVGYYPAGDLADGVATWSIDGKTDIVTSDLWSAGNYEVPVSTGLVFCHRLARLEVICLAESGSALSVVQTMWGTVDSVKLKGALPSMTFSYADHSLSVTGTAVDFPLLDSASYAGALIPRALLANNSAGVITAAAMVAPIDSESIILRIKTSAKADAREVPITLTGKFERAKTHIVTLTFKANGRDIESKSTTIEVWSSGAVGAGDVIEPETPETPEIPEP